MASNKIIGIILLIVVFASGAIWLDFHCALQAPIVTGDSVTIEIEKGDSFNRITDKLLSQNLAIKPFWFKLIAIRQKTFNRLKTGEYELTLGITMPEILTVFAQGKTKQYAITFPEGWSFKQLLEEVNKNPHIEHTLTLDIAENLSETNKDAGFEALMSKIGANVKYPEGLFFPDTYFFEKHTTDVSLLKRAHDKMQYVLQEEWLHKTQDLPLKTPYEALILASIIEKETAAKTERPLIAGVFVRRLQTGMLLQTDPTVIYGMGENYHGDIGYNDLKAETPYNTYVIKGLPPTPIAMPGRDAIYAALHPNNDNTIYFVSRGDGTHIFSATLKDHNLAVDNFQKKKE
ncbi:MAG: endolytic transglycosylase MltG [Methylococcaceae bacterium]